MDTNINRVYVNPNFNRVPSRAIHYSDQIHNNKHLYINPYFTKNTTDVPPLTSLNRKIYVNPNFIKSTNILDRNEISETVLRVKNTSEILEYPNSPVSIYNICQNEKPKQSENISPHPCSKSRYRLVRRHDNRILETKHQIKESCTIKINKYKSIPFNNFKNNLQIVKNETAKQIPSSKGNTSTLLSQYVNRNKFKLVRHNLKSSINISLKLMPKSPKTKKNMDFKSQLKLKVLNGTRNKNNIPCRLFTKYGKCLRNLHDTCEYLHDKKHVSLCRKFIKGICHDKQCLLSHELSSKKMPTCYFYLKGMCTKDDCPYLHVKLSEKSKICPDFLKGYCDKGHLCLHRHVRHSIGKSDKKRYTLNKHTYRNVKLDISQSAKVNELKRLPECKNTKTNIVNRPNEQSKDDGDRRYFKDLQNKEPMCEVLKPTRCKLGTLPSFIRL